jgi:MFS family permease
MIDAPPTSLAAPPDYRRVLLVQLIVSVLAGAAVHGGRPAVSYRALELGASTFEIGLVQSAFSVVPAITAVAIGRFIDRVGERAWIAVSMVIFTVGSVLAAYAGSVLGLAIAQLVVGLGQILYLVASQSFIANYGPRDERDARFGHYVTANSIGQLAGPALAAFVIGGGLGLTAAAGTGGGASVGPAAPSSATGPGLLPGLLPDTPTGLALFAVAVLTALAALFAMSLPRLRRGPRPGSDDGAGQPGMLATTRVLLRRQGMPAAMAISIVVASAVDVVMAYLPVYGDAAGLSVGLVGLLLSIRGIAGLVSRIFMGRLIDLLGRERLLVLSMLLAGGGLVLLPVASGDWFLIGLMIATGLGLGLGQPMTIAWVATRSPRQERATALALRITGNRASLLVIPPLMGAVAGATGVAMVFVILAVAMAGGAAIAATTPLDELAENRDRLSP